MVRISAVKPVRLLPLFVRRTFGFKDTAFFYTSQMTDNKYWGLMQGENYYKYIRASVLKYWGTNG